jgi:hypothetical protein
MINISIVNDASLNSDTLSGIEGQIASLLGNTASPVAVNFAFNGKPDITLTYALNATWLVNLIWDQPMGTQGGSGLLAPTSPTVYVNNLPANIATPALLGDAGFHEVAHQLTGLGDLPFDPGQPNTLSYDYAPDPVKTDALMHPNSTLWTLTPEEAAAISKGCSGLHPQ